MVEIGPNLTSVLLALVAVLASLVSGGVALWTFKAHSRTAGDVAVNGQRLDVVEKAMNGSLAPTKKESTK